MFIEIFGVNGALRKKSYLPDRQTAKTSRILKNTNNQVFAGSKDESALKTAADTLPDLANEEAYCLLGNKLIATGQVDSAEHYYLKALQIKSDYSPAYMGLGWVCYLRNDLPASEQHWRVAYYISPILHDILNNLAMLKLARGRPDQALPLLEKVLAQSPADSRANQFLEQAKSFLREDAAHRDLLYNGGCIDAAEVMARADLARNNSLENHNFLLKCYLASPHHSARDYFEESRSWCVANAHEELLPRPNDFSNDRQLDKRLKVGIVGDYFVGVIGKFTLIPFFKLYDRDRLELFCYNFGNGEEEIRPIVDHYRDIRKLSNQQFFDLVRSDGVDIMLDINGRLRTPNYFNAILRQPAPIVVNWYNLTATVGAKAYNYLIADDFSVRPEDEEFYVERVFRMPTGTISSWDMGPPPKVPSPPIERNGYITFACFADAFKVNEGVLASWATLLQRVPHSRLYLKNNSSLHLLSERNRVAEYFLSQGISPERLSLEGSSPYQVMNKLYELVDIALDTFPFSSGSTSINALWQGVPVVAISGNSWRERNTASILSGAGLDCFIANDIDAYILKAEELAGDKDLLARFRMQLGEHLYASPQWQTKDFAINFESRLRMIWKDWLTQETRGEQC
jgi:predicted O-linked N-acetylglucosamine transferase (SPINDLY family)